MDEALAEIGSVAALGGNQHNFRHSKGVTGLGAGNQCVHKPPERGGKRTVAAGIHTHIVFFFDTPT